MQAALASPLWNLLYVGATLVMLGYAYYSRNREIQTIAGYLFISYLAGAISGYTQFATAVMMTSDVIGLVFCLVIWRRNPVNTTGLWVANIFSAMLLSHYIGLRTGLPYYIALNMLYLAQVAIITINGKRYGKAARIDQQQRDDPFYRMAVWAKNE